MELKIKIITCNACDNCKVTVQDNSTYLSEDNVGTVKGKFKFSDTISIDILQLNKSQEAIYLDPTFTDHSSLGNSTLQVSSDGWYSLVHIVLPSKEWFERELNKVSQRMCQCNFVEIVGYIAFITCILEAKGILNSTEHNTIKSIPKRRSTQNIVSGVAMSLPANSGRSGAIKNSFPSM